MKSKLIISAFIFICSAAVFLVAQEGNKPSEPDNQFEDLIALEPEPFVTAFGSFTAEELKDGALDKAIEKADELKDGDARFPPKADELKDGDARFPPIK